MYTIYAIVAAFIVGLGMQFGTPILVVPGGVALFCIFLAALKRNLDEALWTPRQQ